MQNIKKAQKCSKSINYQDLSEEEKSKKREYARNRYSKLFIENELSKKQKKNRKTESVNMLANNIKIFLKKKKIKGANMHMKNIDIFRKKKKTGNANMRVSDVEVFLKNI